MSQMDNSPEISMDGNALSREEVYTDSRVGTIRKMTPVTIDGEPDSGRDVQFIGSTQIMTPGGALPLSFEIETEGFALVPSAVQSEALGLNLAVVSALLVLGAGAWAGFRLLLRVHVLRRLPRPVARSLLRTRRAIRAMQMHPGPAAAAVVLSLFVQASFVVTALLVGDAMGLHLDVRIWFLIWPLAKMASMMPASLGGIGLLELAFRSLAAPFGDAEVAVAVALVMQTIRIGLGLVSGTYWFTATPRR